MDKLLVVSPCFYPTAQPAELMVKSAALHGLNVHLYGIGEQFIPHGAHAQVFVLNELMKLDKMADYILVTDCRDVLFCAGESQIVNKFEAFNRELLMSTERGCWPPEPEIVKAFHSSTPYGYDYINAGQYIGTWEYVQHCLERLLVRYRGTHPGADNSQGWWMWALMRGELNFRLDWCCDIFQSMSQGADSHLIFIDKTPYNQVTCSFPCSIHYNGNPGNDEPQKEMFKRLFQ